jgi:hypothetical protein
MVREVLRAKFNGSQGSTNFLVDKLTRTGYYTSHIADPVVDTVRSQ